MAPGQLGDKPPCPQAPEAMVLSIPPKTGPKSHPIAEMHAVRSCTAVQQGDGNLRQYPQPSKAGKPLQVILSSSLNASKRVCDPDNISARDGFPAHLVMHLLQHLPSISPNIDCGDRNCSHTRTLPGWMGLPGAS